MSEKKTVVELKESDRKLLQSLTDHFKKEPEVAKEKPEEAKHEHFTVDASYLEQADACPECKKGLDDFGKEYMRKTLEERSKLPYVCKDCGLGVKEDDEKCPNCGGEDAETR